MNIETIEQSAARLDELHEHFYGPGAVISKVGEKAIDLYFTSARAWDDRCEYVRWRDDMQDGPATFGVSPDNPMWKEWYECPFRILASYTPGKKSQP